MHRPDLDLSSGSFRLDLKTGVLLLALLAQWWDNRAQADKQSAIFAVQNAAMQKSLEEVQRLQNLQQYDLGSIKIALAEKGIKVRKAE